MAARPRYFAGVISAIIDTQLGRAIPIAILQDIGTEDQTRECPNKLLFQELTFCELRQSRPRVFRLVLPHK